MDDFRTYLDAYGVTHAVRREKYSGTNIYDEHVVGFYFYLRCNQIGIDDSRVIVGGMPTCIACMQLKYV